jgi:hypothetical protein
MTGCNASAPPTPVQSPAHSCLTRLAGQETEGHSVTPGVSLWVCFRQLPIARAKQTKTAWRMTGSGTIHITAVSPASQEIAPVWTAGASDGLCK